MGEALGNYYPISASKQANATVQRLLGVFIDPGVMGSLR